MNVTFSPARARTLERTMELIEESGAEVLRGDLFIAGLPSAINALAGALENAGFKLGSTTPRGRMVVEKLARRDDLILHLRTTL